MARDLQGEVAKSISSGPFKFLQLFTQFVLLGEAKQFLIAETNNPKNLCYLKIWSSMVFLHLSGLFNKKHIVRYVYSNHVTIICH